MERTKPIFIACPQYRVTVRGTYVGDTDGNCAPGPGGKYMLKRVRCSHNGGRCMQTLCALHRYNRGGNGSWYPEIILTLPDRKPPPPSDKSGMLV